MSKDVYDEVCSLAPFDVCLKLYVKEFKPTQEELVDLLAKNTDDKRKTKEISKYLKRKSKDYG